MQAITACRACREYIWNDPPLVYDRNGDPAIAIKFVGGEEGGLDALRKNVLSIVQNAECVISEGKWTDKPINIVDRQGRTLGHYTGTALSADTDWTQIIMQRPPAPEVSEDAANIRRQMAERLKRQFWYSVIVSFLSQPTW